MEAVPERAAYRSPGGPNLTHRRSSRHFRTPLVRAVSSVAVFTAGEPEQIAPAMDKAKAWGATALNVLSAPLFSINRRIVIERAAALGLPAIYEWPEMAEEGGLIGIRPASYADLSAVPDDDDNAEDEEGDDEPDDLDPAVIREPDE